MMKSMTRIITFFAAAAFAVSCKPTESKPSAEAEKRETTASPLERVEKKTNEAVQAAKDYAYAERAKYLEKLKGDLAQINQEIERLSTNVERSNNALKAEAREKLQALRAEAAQFNTELDRAKSATESTWGDVKAGFKKSLSALEDSLNRARQWLSEKIAP